MLIRVARADVVGVGGRRAGVYLGGRGGNP